MVFSTVWTRGHFYSMLILCFTILGCAEEPLEFTEVKRIDEKMTEAELNAFLKVIELLPQQKLPQFPQVFSPPPDWNKTRTLPVKDLVSEEQHMTTEHWSVDYLAWHLERNRPFQRALKQVELTPEQFIGLALTLGVALSRDTLREDQENFQQTIQRGKNVLDRLKKDERPFSSLSDEGRYFVLQQALWITRVDRAKHLRMVPPENIDLVRKYRDTLVQIFPDQFTENPLDEVADMLEQKGMVFLETSKNRADDQIQWTPQEAVVGNDRPDPGLRKKKSYR